jgi:hypothetical protein
MCREAGKSEQQNIEPAFAKQRLRRGRQGMSNFEVAPPNEAFLRDSAVLLLAMA